MERNEEQNARVQLPFAEKNQPVELTAEISLPDYRSEISRLLWVRPVLLPPTRFVGGGKAEFSGPICYHILYVGPDGALYSADHEESYAFSLPLESLADFESGEGAEISVEMIPDAVVSRVIGPRKLSVRCRLRAQMQGYAVKNLTPRLQGEGELYRLCRGVENGKVLFGEAERLELGNRITVEPGEGELRVISTNGNLLLSRVTAGDGNVHCAGEAVMEFLMVRENGEASVPFVTECRIPFEKDLTLEGVTPDVSVRAFGVVGEMQSAVEEDNVSVEATVMLTAEGQTEESVLLCEDLFSPGQVADYRFAEERFWRAGPCGNRNFTVSGEKSLAEIGLATDAERIFLVCDGEIREKRAEGDKTLIAGDLCCHLLYRRGGEYAICDFSIPFRTFLEGAWDRVSLSCNLPVCRITPVRDGESLRVDAEVYLSLRSSKQEPNAVLAEARFTPGEKRETADMEICYPAPGETLWNVSKRYGVAPVAVANANALSAEAPGAASSLDGVRYLLIP
ncbi:MAG: hypothetical protein E7585_06905 [Ruminococcaceae bacterium]|nr:hypothetical protein [Oscillospiraceae bacterium]